ncbi:MAG: 50S ribosomal protein L21 [Dehalococcoidia bacterium]|nr:50S ribosomal protein L21 [Dehalococcoidia bacterium]
MYAIVESGGKQHKVEVGANLLVDHLQAEEGAAWELERVLLVSDGTTTLVGKPTVQGAVVRAVVTGEVKGPKIVVQKYKAKSNYRVKTGHRQLYTNLAIKEIVLPAKAKKGK